MFGPSLMNQNEFSLEVTNVVFARILFSACWNIVWCIKTNFLFKYCIQWLQEYCFLHVGTFCAASKRIFFWSIVFNDCKNTVFHMLGPSLKNQNEFSLEVMNARILFSTYVHVVYMLGPSLMNQNGSSFELLYTNKSKIQNELNFSPQIMARYGEQVFCYWARYPGWNALSVITGISLEYLPCL